jgi:hypothetical protein
VIGVFLFEFRQTVLCCSVVPFALDRKITPFMLHKKFTGLLVKMKVPPILISTADSSAVKFNGWHRVSP